MQFSSENYDDIRKYYLNTYVKIKEFGDLLFYINRVDRTQVSGLVEDGREFDMWLDKDHPYEIDYVLPHKSFFQYEKDAAQLYRVPARQYQRGLSTGNTRIARVNQAGEKEEVGDGGLDFKLLKAYVSKQPFVSLSQAIGKSNPEGRRSFVLTPRLMFHRQTKSLFMDFIRVADVAPETREIKLIHPIFRPEIEAFLKQTNETATFKVQHA